MKSVIFLGKRKSTGSPKAQWPGAELAGTTHSNQKYARRYGTVDDWDSWWDLHPFDPVPGYDGIKKRRLSTYRWYQTLPGPGEPGYRPLWLAELDPSIRAGVLFPTDEVLDYFELSGHGRWFSCQVDLMMAYHIMRGYEHIILHGHGTQFVIDACQPNFRAPVGHRIDVSSQLKKLRHMVDHCGVLVWMTVARERGIKVTIIEPSWYVGPQNPYGVSPGHWGFRA